MKKMKRFFALFLAMAMVLGMSMTTFAAGETATITVRNAETGDKFYHVQIIEADASKSTGWDFVDGYADAFKTAFPGADEQTIIANLIQLVNPAEETTTDQLVGFQTGYSNALKAIYDQVGSVEESQLTGSSFTVDKPGVWFIKGYSNDYTYNPMAAYVAFKKYVSSAPTQLEDKTIDAKKVKNSMEKDATSTDETDNVTQIGREVKYTVNTMIPYVQAYSANAKYIVVDILTGADYVVVADGQENAGKVKVDVTIGSATNSTPYYATVKSVSDGNKTSFELDLSSLLANNANANETLKLEYSAKVTDLVVNNEVKAGDGTNDTIYKSSSTDLYTGKIELQKWDDGKGAARKALAGAGFEIRTVATGEGDALKVVPFEQDGAVVPGEYVYAPEATKEEGATTEVITNTNGKVVVYGLDIGTYYFKEVSAPEGFSINTDLTKNSVISVDTNDQVATAATDVKNTTGEITNTRLSALPSTGGIGTTIFTVGGCAIMILAAGMFFVSRRRAAK